MRQVLIGERKGLFHQWIKVRQYPVAIVEFTDGSIELFNFDEIKFLKAKATAKKKVLDFEEVYKDYPRKMGKKDGLKIFKTHITTEEKYDALLIAKKNFIDLHKNKEPKYIRGFDRFMRTWEDFLEKDEIEKTNDFDFLEDE